MNNKNLPTRTKDVALRITAKAFDEATGEVRGYASIFGNIDHVGDVVEQGAFAKTLAHRGDRVRFLWQHNRLEVIGKIVELKEDEKGLFFRAIFANTPRGQEARELLKMDALDGFSIGYHVIQEKRDEQPDGRIINRLQELRLVEISAVTHACNEEARAIGVKEHLANQFDALTDEEQELVAKYMEELVDLREKADEEPADITNSDAETEQSEPTPEAEPDPELEELRAVKETLELDRLLKTLRELPRD